MNETTALHPITQSGWRLGFGNIVRKESRDWWSTNRWWIQTVLWLGLINGLVGMVLFVLPQIQPADVGAAEAFEGALETFFGIAYLGVAIGVIILVHDEIVGERQSGTAAWVLSKPVSRQAFLLAKLGANGFAAIVVMLLLPGTVTFLQFFLATGSFLPAGPFLMGLGLVALSLLFYLSLSLMIGALTYSRQVVLGAPILVVLAWEFLPTFIPPILLIGPRPLPNIATGLVMGTPVPAEMFAPILATAVWIVVFVGVALWRLARIEF